MEAGDPNMDVESKVAMLLRIREERSNESKPELQTGKMMQVAANPQASSFRG